MHTRGRLTLSNGQQVFSSGPFVQAPGRKPTETGYDLPETRVTTDTTSVLYRRPTLATPVTGTSGDTTTVHIRDMRPVTAAWIREVTGMANTENNATTTVPR